MKKFSILLVLVLAIAVVFCSCGKKESETPYDYDLGEYVTLGTFPNVAIDMDEAEKLLDEAIEDVASQYAEKAEVKDRAVQDGDIANIDYTGKMDGKEFEGGSDKGYDLEIGSGSFIAGFEEGIIGKNIGDEFDLKLVFPEDYSNKELQGKDVVFTVKVNSIQSKTVPALSDEMVEEKTDYASVSEFIENKEKEIVEDLLWENYIDSCKMLKYPDAEVKTYYDQMVNSYNAMALSNGMTLESMVTSFYGYSSVDDFLSYTLESAMLTVKEEIVIWKTVRDNDIALTDEEYEKLGAELAKEASYESLKEYEEYAGANTIKLQIYMDKIVGMAVAANDIKFGATEDIPSDEIVEETTVETTVETVAETTATTEVAA